MRGLCEVLAKCEREHLNYHKTQRGNASPDANDGRKGGRNIITLLYLIYKPLTSVVKRRKQNHKISFHFFATPPCTPRRFFERKEIFGFGLRPEGARGAHCSLHHAIRAYDSISSHHARGACEDQSLCDWKKVRAKVNISAQNDTSDFESEREPRAKGAQTGRIRRRVATKWEGDGVEKWAVLSLVSYPKIIFINFNIKGKNYEQTKIFSLRSQINRR